MHSRIKSDPIKGHWPKISRLDMSEAGPAMFMHARERITNCTCRPLNLCGSQTTTRAQREYTESRILNPQFGQFYGHKTIISAKHPHNFRPVNRLTKSYKLADTNQTAKSRPKVSESVGLDSDPQFHLGAAPGFAQVSRPAVAAPVPAAASWPSRRTCPNVP